MDLVTPAIGLVFWTTITFLILLFLLTKFAWKPILGAVKAREASIEDALRSAEKAREEMENLQADNERILQEARMERDAVLKEAREMKDKIIADAKEMAKEQADSLTRQAREAIQNEKMAAITEIKNQMADLSIDIAQRVLREEFKDASKQRAMIDKMLDEANLQQN
jgi:F-type H+-transporting ATPase subunit b